MNLALKQFLTKHGKYIISLPTDDEKCLSVSRNFSKKTKNFLNHKQEHNVSLKSWRKVDTKKIEYLIVINKQEKWYYSKPSAIF